MTAGTGDARRIRCVGCGGSVPDGDGPTHRYIGASPGCWAIYGELLATGGLAAPPPHGALTVDAYAVQHPGVPGPQSTQSVWVHLIALHLVLEAGWPVERAIRLRQAAADAADGWPWLEPPLSPGTTTVADVAAADPAERAAVIGRWVDAAWQAWEPAHPQVRQRAARIVAGASG